MPWGSKKAARAASPPPLVDRPREPVTHKLVEEDPREVVVATVLLGAQARLEGLLVDLEEEVEVDLFLFVNTKCTPLP